MTSIYRDDIKGTRELFSSILDNRLNNAMKYLTSITLLMAVPTVISGLYGMNVRADGMPFASSTAGFAIVLGLTPGSVRACRRGCCTKSTCCKAGTHTCTPTKNVTPAAKKQAFCCNICRALP